MIDIVIPLRCDLSNWYNNELRFCLRSIEKNFRENFRVVLMSDKKPEWIENIVFVECPKWFPEKGDSFHAYENFFDTLNKIDIASKSPIISEEFIYCYDDIILMKEIDLSFFDKNYASSHISFFKRLGRWANTILKASGVGGDDFYVYDHHIPVKLKKEYLVKMFKEYPFRNQKYPYAPISMYFNLLVSKPDLEIGYGSNAIVSYNEIGDSIWLNYSDSGLEKVKDWIVDNFKNESIYEVTEKS